ncbi:MAG TPA: glycosyltransferase [Candidatus Polarisedimenticolia bacterium]|nr:glycosyltransferase [Candidatus Polarisedimenticolia bacterium]
MAEYILLGIAAIPFIYYLLALFSTARFFTATKRELVNNDFFPPVSCLKPIKGLDEDAYENYASFCRQDYPAPYEIVFCVDRDDPALPVLEKLIRDFPERPIRLLFGSGRNAINDKVGRLYRLTTEAKYDLFVITDGDVRVCPDYLRTAVSPFRDRKVGAATCLYVSTKETNFVQELQSVGMISDFFAPVMVAWQLNDLKVTFGQSILTTREAVNAYGGYQILEDRPADDVYAGRLVAEKGYEVKLLPYVVQSVADFQTMSDLLHKRTRWMTVQRLMRPWGHVGLIFTFGLPWAIVAVATHPTAAVALGYLGGYAACRMAITWMIGAWGMKQKGLWKKMWLIPIWDGMAFLMWVASFRRKTIRWRGVDYFLREGRLVSASRAPAAKSA